MRRIGPDQQAVSQVLGVILMVAIAVTLALVVFVIVSPVSDRSSDNVPPRVSYDVQEADGVLRVLTIQRGPVDWADMDVTGCAKPASSGPMLAGDLLTDCTGDIKIVHTPTNALLFQTTFP